MTYEEMERSFEFMKELQIKLEQFQVESEEQHTRWHVNFQRSLDALLQQQSKSESEMRELKDWGKELAKSQVRMQNSLSDLGDSHKQLAESHGRLEESLRQLADTQKQTDERFSSFLAALERRFGSNGHF